MRWRTVFLVLPLLGACELTEVTVPPGEPRVVVHAVLRRGATTQFVIVEEALIGQASDPSIPPPPGPFPGLPQHPIADAMVTLSYAVGSHCGPAVDVLPALEQTGYYQGRELCTPEPGDVVSLEVATAGGRVVTGTTTIPGARSVEITAGGDPVGTESGPFNRDHDTLRIDVEPLLARAMQVEIRRRGQGESIFLDAQAPLVFYAVLDTLGFTFPGDLINPFEGDSGEVVLRGGITYDVTVAVTDTNYYDFARSFSDPLTGRGFLNHLEGGLGVFGAVDAHTRTLRVVADVDQPREGLYRLQGELDSLAVDVTLELYLDEVDAGVFAAFIEGTWYGEEIAHSIDGIFADAEGEPDRFEAGFEVPTSFDVSPRWALRGRRAPFGHEFQVEVIGYVGRPEAVIGTLDAVQLSDPGT
jgi:hypothetical protein